MSWSYDPKTLADNPKDQIRLKVGDTIELEPLLEDEEILFYLAECNNDITRTAYKCVSIIIARICSAPDYTLGPYSESNANRLKAFCSIKNELADALTGYNAPLAKTPTTEPIFAYDMMSNTCCNRREDDHE